MFFPVDRSDGIPTGSFAPGGETSMRAVAKNLLRYAGYTLLEHMPVQQSERSRAHESQKYWSDVNQRAFHSNSHWKGGEGLPERVWLELGKPHLKLMLDHLTIRGRSLPVGRVVEWGCGGGANAVHFAPMTKSFVGVDISQATLDECSAVLRSMGQENFQPVLTDVSNPEAAADALAGTADVFLCTYVFELLPSQEHGQRILDIANRVLRPGGTAIIQIKYETADRKTKSRKWGYRRNLANMTTYCIDDFWHRTERAGFIPVSISLRPKDNLIDDERYAYFVLDKPAS
ncbi:class I SAM-dependent methyltransferase [Shinella sp.]|uniref:class I SAM-dependent methyltransferase n=2 Tax=Shinella sp. TaxID=1870904 RepID=UPI0028A9D8A0|nr:class I SAM-dependent methyltransferase [Shinella sp.]